MKNSVVEISKTKAYLTPTARSHKKIKPHKCHKYAEGLAQSHADSLIVVSLSVNSYVTKVFDSVDFVVKSLTPLASTISPSSLQQDFPCLAKCLVLVPCICVQ